jgi:hypothetical protein
MQQTLFGKQTEIVLQNTGIKLQLPEPDGFTQ